MARRQSKLYTIYHAMEAQGEFDANPANRSAVNNEGQPIYRPQEYPKMLYHPEGEKRVLKLPQEIFTRSGDPFTPPRYTAAVEEIIWMMADNRQQEMALRADGWHDHPAKAIGKRDGPDKAPPMGADWVIKDLQAEGRQQKHDLDAAEKRVAQLEQELADAKAAGAPGGRQSARHRPLLDPTADEGSAR